MLTRLAIRNFKRFEAVEIDLGQSVVFIGPNNSGKTTALQALALWNLGVKRWNEKRAGKSTPETRPGVTINRRDMIAVPVPEASLLWRDMHVRDAQRTNGKPATRNVNIEILVEGVSNGASWRCGLEFDYANPESFYCRPMRSAEDPAGRMAVPPGAAEVEVAFLPPMSGLFSNETRLDPGAINVRLGEGRTAEVLRNLCFLLSSSEDGRWDELCEQILSLFGVHLKDPDYVTERGEISLVYQDRGGIVLDLSSSGRGMQQTLLLLAYLSLNPGSVILLDEPDAHLEILRQREIYQILTAAAARTNSQIVAASHSEVILNEAAGRDVVVAFVGKPHRIDDKGSQVLKSLRDIRAEDYYQAEQTGWILYLEGSTDLAILREFARLLGHESMSALERPFVHYTGNQPNEATTHFTGLREAKPDLAGFALFDRLPRPLPERPTALGMRQWSRREIENYVCSRDVLLRWAEQFAVWQSAPLFSSTWVEIMEKAIQEVETAIQTIHRTSPWSPDTKVTDDFLDPVFRIFFERAGMPALFRKADYHHLVQYLSADDVDAEVVAVLNELVESARKARPAKE